MLCAAVCAVHAHDLDYDTVRHGNDAWAAQGERLWVAGAGTNFRAVAALCAVPEGTERVILDVHGPGIIRHLLLNYHGLQAPDGLVLRAWWDDAAEPAVCLPLADAFTLQTELPISYWPMPFARRARLSVSNECDTLAAVSYTINGEYLPALPADALRFHACWRRSNPTRDGRHTALTTAGRGHIAAVVYKVRRLAPGTVTDGRDLFYIDGAPAPTLAGTSLAEYFHGLGATEPYALSYSGHSVSRAPSDVDGTDFATLVERYYRVHLHDPIRFTRAITVCFEQRSYLGTLPSGQNNIALDYGMDVPYVTPWTTNGMHNRVVTASNDVVSVIYWYQTAPHTPQPFCPQQHQQPFVSRFHTNATSGAMQERLEQRRYHSFFPYMDVARARCVPVPLGAAAVPPADAGADAPHAVPAARRLWAGVPFAMTPAPGGTGVACIIHGPGHRAAPATIPCHVYAQRLYVLCAATGSHRAAYGAAHGRLEVAYANGARAAQNITDGEHVSDWRFGRHTSLVAGKIGWLGSATNGSDRALYVFRAENPLPHVAITNLTLHCAGSGATLYVLGITAEQPAAAPP
jgi:hypothetical protein